ncbi:MAG TPA: DUF3558 domain-containing protein [Propionibacteriaceae bacterium]|nr:DUF3558 domain-containing protein [Propionibacteriaceae bacterium]
MRLVLLMVTAVLVAGCTTVVSGSPSAPSGLLLPPRPREVRLDGVDPCSLLTAEQRARLGFDSEPRASKPNVELFRGEVPTCTIRGPYPDVALLISGTVTTVGVERWFERDIAADLRPTTVAGFPSIVAAPTRFTDYCNVEVDVAVGQLLDVQYGGGHPHAPIEQQELCRRARAAAELMMISLLRT